MRRTILPALVVAAALAVGACGGGATTAPSQPAAQSAAPSAAASAAQSAAASAATGGSDSVDIKNFAFNPSTLTAKVGAKVTWKNSDSTAHTVTFDDGSADSNDIANNATFEHTFAAAGTFAYHCKIHTNMKGTITVS
jgi:plastocyanin